MNYWEKRFERLKQQQMGKAETVTAAMRREYIRALTSLRKEVLDWYYRYAEENEMSLADARKELDTRELRAFQLTLKEYIKLAKKKDLPQKYIKMLDKASIRARLDRGYLYCGKIGFGNYHFGRRFFNGIERTLFYRTFGGRFV